VYDDDQFRKWDIEGRTIDRMAGLERMKTTVARASGHFPRSPDVAPYTKCEQW